MSEGGGEHKSLPRDSYSQAAGLYPGCLTGKAGAEDQSDVGCLMPLRKLTLFVITVVTLLRNDTITNKKQVNHPQTPLLQNAKNIPLFFKAIVVPVLSSHMFRYLFHICSFSIR